MRFRTRYLLPVAALLLLLLVRCAAPPHRTPAGSAPAAATPASAVIRVGAWNIEWLGTPDRRSGAAEGRARAPEYLAAYILAANVDVLGVEEIRIDADDGSDTSTLLTAALELVGRQRGGHWEQRLFPTSYGRDQCCGIAWDAAKVTPLGEPRVVTDPHRRSSQAKSLWSRPPRGIEFSAGAGLTDFVVVVLHMKADYRGDFATHRAEEAESLVADLPGAFTDPDVLILGDSNCDAHDEPAVTTLCAAGFVDLNADDLATHWRYGALDRAFVPQNQPEFARHDFEVLRDAYLTMHHLTNEAFKINYSDHFMIITEIDVQPDDD